MRTAGQPIARVRGDRTRRYRGAQTGLLVRRFTAQESAEGLRNTSGRPEAARKSVETRPERALSSFSPMLPD
jgi:hypothetical protein